MGGLVRLSLVGLVLLLALVGLAACAKEPTEAPALPAGFTGDVPDVALDGFLFISQGQAFTLPASFASTPDPLVVGSLTVFFAPSQPEEAAGMVASFSAGAQAQAAFDAVPEASNRWKLLSGNDLFLVVGAGPGAEALKAAFQSRNFVKLETREPEVWNGMKWLPTQPPSQVIGVGYLKPTPELVERLKKASANVGDVSGAVEQGKIDFAVVGLYGSPGTDIAGIKSAQDLQARGVGALFVAKMGIPAVTVGAVFGTVARMIGLEEAEFEGEKAFTRDLEGLSVLLKAKSGHVFGAVSPSQDFSWRLLQSVLNKK